MFLSVTSNMYQAAHRSKRSQPPRWVLRQFSPGTEYFGEDSTYWYFVTPGANPALGGFFDNMGNMFTRMVKFTPKSFTPGNIYKGFINTTLTVASGGLYQALPKDLKKTVYEVGKVAVPVIAGGVLAATAGPAVMGVLQPKLSAAAGFLGQHASTIGKNLFDFIGKLGPSQQAHVAEQITPEQIVAMEQSNQVPSSLLPYFNQMAAQSFPEPSSGAASLYDPGAMAQVELDKQQRAQGVGFNPAFLLLVGAPVALFMFMGKR